MVLKLVRIDFRLIHGQVMTRWVKNFSVDHIIIIDDKSASSMILKKILLAAAPEDVEVEVIKVSEAAERWTNDTLSKKNLMILFKDPQTAANAWESGVKFNKLQIGGIEGSSEKKNIVKNIVMSKEEVNVLLPLHENGVNIYAQPIPEDTEYSFENIKSKF